MNKKTFFGTAIMLLLLGAVLFISLFLGAQKISPIEFLKSDSDSFQRIIVFELRLPRILLSILCGALLGGSGAVLQGFFRNPLADSGILGISSGASFGAIVCGLFPLANFSFKFFSPVPLFAFAGGLLSGLLIFLFSLFFKRGSSVTTLLLGTVVGTFFSSLSSITILLREKDLHSIYAWTMGSFNGKSWNELFFILPASIASFFLLYLCSSFLDILGGGEKNARSLGLNLKTSRIMVLVSSSLATSCAVCAGGTISFVGLMAPHLMRSIFGPKHKSLVPLSMISGSLLLLTSDLLARTVAAPTEIPIGIITSIVGIPFFIFVLKKENYVQD